MLEFITSTAAQMAIDGCYEFALVQSQTSGDSPMMIELVGTASFPLPKHILSNKDATRTLSILENRREKLNKHLAGMKPGYIISKRDGRDNKIIVETTSITVAVNLARHFPHGCSFVLDPTSYLT